MAVGKALLTIRDRRIYREGYKNFEDYCNERWQMSRHYAHKLIGGSEIATNLLTAVNIPHPCEIQPVHERQVRPLTVLEPNQQRDVWEEAVRTAPVGKVCHFRTPAISVSGELSDETAETASGPSGLGSGRRWAGDGPRGPLAAWQGYPCLILGCPLCVAWWGCGGPESS